MPQIILDIETDHGIVRGTSRGSLKTTVQTGERETHAALYLRKLREMGKPSTDQEVAHYAQVPLLTIERARYHLYEQGELVDDGIKTCSITGHRAHRWWFNTR